MDVCCPFVQPARRDDSGAGRPASSNPRWRHACAAFHQVHREKNGGVAAALRTALGKDPEITTRVDPALLGGLKVRVGSRLFDASLKSRLDSLKFALKRA